MPYKPEHHHYEHAPIQEALIGLVLERPNSITLGGVAGIDLSSRGYSKKSLHMAQIEGRIAEGKATASADHEHVGYEFTDSTKMHVARLLLDRFSFSRLMQYDCWQQLSDEALLVWKMFRSLSPTTTVNQVGLRFINRIDMPEPIRDFRDYIRLYPEISSDLPQALSGLLLRVAIPFEDGTLLNLTEVMVPPPKPGITSMILDIDVVKANVALISDVEIWEVLDSLRDKKNLVFESCITNATRSLIS